MPALCKHPQVRVVAREEDAEFVECQLCREVFDSSEFPDILSEDEPGVSEDQSGVSEGEPAADEDQPAPDEVTAKCKASTSLKPRSLPAR